MKFARVVLLGLCLISVATAADDSAPRKIGSVEGFTEYQLANGLKVVLFADPSKPKLIVNMTILVGSRHEGYGETGMAHLLEHMLFKPTEKHPHPDRDLQERGADYNGTTWFDRTNYYETLPASDENLDFAIALEADRLVNCPIKAEDLASEMTVVRNEFEMGENSPKNVLEQRMFATAFEWHNYGKSTIGNRADIERVPAERLREFYKRYYRTDNTVLFIAGRIDEAKALALVQKHFDPIPKPGEPIRSTYTEEPAQDGERLVTLRRVGKVPWCGVVYHVPAASDPDFAPVAVLEAIISADKTGRLYKSLVERRVATKVEGTVYPLHDPGAMMFFSEVAADQDPHSVVEAMTETIDQLADKGVNEEEVTRAKRTLAKLWEQLAEDTPKFVVSLSDWAGAENWRLTFLFRDRLKDVTIEDVNRVAAKYLKTSNRTVGVYIPTKEPQRTPIPAAPDLANVWKDYKGNTDVSIGEKFDPSPAAIEARVKRSTIEGVKVALLSKKNRGESVVIRLRLRYGSAKSLFDMTTSCGLLPPLMLRGTKSMNAAEISDRQDELECSIGADGKTGEAEFALQTTRKHIVEVLDLLRQILREPTFPESELTILKEDRAASLKEQSAEPQPLASRTVSQKLSPYPVGDVRYVPAIPEEIKLVSAIDRKAIQRLYDEFLGASAGELVIVGDFDEAEVTRAATKMLSGWKSKQAFERISRNGEKPPEGQTIRLRTPDKAQAIYLAGMTIPLRDDDPEYPALIIGNDILGGSGFASRLMGRVREKEGLSYGVGTILRPSSFDRRAVFSAYAIFNPENTDKVASLMREEIDRFVKDGATKSEVEESKSGYLQSHQAGRGEDSKLALSLADLLYAGRTLKFQGDLEDAVSKLTREQVQSAMKKLIDASRLVIVIAGDISE